jgi:hypothetical protein
VRIIHVHSRGQSEHWLEVHEDGQIIHHSENDGYAVARYGLQARDREITIAEVACLGGELLVEQVRLSCRASNGSLSECRSTLCELSTVKPLLPAYPAVLFGAS